MLVQDRVGSRKCPCENRTHFFLLRVEIRSCAASRGRTCDIPIKSRKLYQLSYGGKGGQKVGVSPTHIRVAREEHFWPSRGLDIQLL